MVDTWKVAILIIVVAGSLAGVLAFTGILFQASPVVSTGNTQVQPEIRASYTWQYADTACEVVKPLESNKFLILHLTVENRGYPSFPASPDRDLYVKAGNQEYNGTSGCVFQSYQPVELKNGQKMDWDVVFQVPKDTASFTAYWREQIGQYKIILVQTA